MNRTLDLHQLDRPYAGLRTVDEGRQARLLAAIKPGSILGLRIDTGVGAIAQQ